MLVEGTAYWNKKLFHVEMKLYKCTNCVWRNRGRNRGFSNFTYVIVAVYFTYFDSFINTCRPCYVYKKAYKPSAPEF